MMLRMGLTLLVMLWGSMAGAATLGQTAHFAGATAEELFELYMSGAGQERITGLPARYLDDDAEVAGTASVGDRLQAFCFEPERCGLQARVLDIHESPGRYTVVIAWWNFGWVSAVDPTDYSVDGRGAPDSTLILTFSDTLTGAEVSLVQANVPDYKVAIPNPDGTTETGPLSRIVNTHWNTLYWNRLRAIVEAPSDP